ncbi:MAG: tRNA pseudouridine(13) synthase TruD [Lysobacterales bacterium]
MTETPSTDPARYQLPRWPRSNDQARGNAVFKQAVDDFVVRELMDVELSGSGEFLWVQVTKRSTNTQDVCALLAKSAGLPSRAVSHSGLKDRQSIASQWFSLHLPGLPDPDLPEQLGSTVTILNRCRHQRKLRIGTHRGNAFEIRLRDCTSDPQDLDQRCSRIRDQGVPNYFGEQRFGRGGDNLRQALTLYTASRKKRRSRHLEGLLHSSARAFLFNQVLARRVEDASWCQGMDGDIWMLDGSRSIFGPEPLTDELIKRCQEGDISPTGPLYGLDESSELPELEQEVLAQYSEYTQGLQRAKARPARRRLALRPTKFQWAWDDADLLLKFELSRGEYATSIVSELIDIKEN